VLGEVGIRVEAGPVDAAPLTARLPVGMLAAEAVTFAAVARGSSMGTVDRIATAFTSERHFRVGGEPAAVWAPLSGFWAAGDGWLRTHGNYPHHAARLVEALGIPATPEALRDRLASMSARAAEELIVAGGGVAAAVRTEQEWAAHPHGAVVGSLPLVVAQQRSAGAPRSVPGARVLDLTRVIAGPVCTRTLGLWGADVLRVDPPGLPEIEWQHLDTGAGKRSTVLDVRSARFRELVAQADVLVHGYRPGALPVQEVVAAHPSLVVASLSAWGAVGPWAGRRGFDSIVQAASGIAMLESPDGIRPGALPAQALDHSAGYFLAGAVATALGRGGGWTVSTSLARIAYELLSMDRTVPPLPGDFPPTTVTHGALTYARPALHADDFAHPPRAWGQDPPEFR
jgi:crotonobetainyl-CoA:carnitine CoA-transferase CaiB-like acyl-CoA transferase